MRDKCKAFKFSVQRHKFGGHSHFLQENLSARVVSRGVVGDRQDVIGPVLWCISPPNKHISSDVNMTRCAEDSMSPKPLQSRDLFF